MDPTLQKRLIGASVLIVLAIIFVPMLLDGSRDTGGERLPLAIPEVPERDFETREVPLDLPAASAPAGVAEAIGVDPVVTAAPVSAAADAAGSPDAVAVVDAAATPRVAALAEVAPAAAPVAPPVSDHEAAPQPRPANANPAPASQPPPAPPADPIAASGRFSVVLGSYANAANAGTLAAALRSAGFRVQTDNVVVGDRKATRLRVGPYATRGQAEAARLEVRRLRPDLPAAISEADDTPAADAPAIAHSAAATSVWAVQVGAFKVEAEANAKRDQLRQAGFAAFVEKINSEAGALWRVRIGPENQRADADAVKAGIQRRFGIDGIVVPYP